MSDAEIVDALRVVFTVIFLVMAAGLFAFGVLLLGKYERGDLE